MARNGTAYKRILLKLSGEALKAPGAESGIDAEAIAGVAERIRKVVESGVQVALVVGAGNIFRGLPASRNGMARVTADSMGMMATVINALGLQDALEAAGVPAQIQTPFPMPGIGEAFDHRRAIAHLETGRVVIFAGGTGHPFFTTDTTAALRACEIGADAIFKATKVDGVYSADPHKDPQARRYSQLAYTDALQKRLQVMDSSAFSLCMDNDIPIVVFNFSRPGGISRALSGDLASATIVGHGETLAETE